MLYIASDHAGFELKEKLKSTLAEWGVTLVDMGPTALDPHDDYPDYALPLSKKVVTEGARGILICGNGVGVCIAANKVAGVHAGIGYSVEAARTMRADDNTNILCLPGRVPLRDHIEDIVRTWIATPFSHAERHTRRLKKIEAMDS